MANINILREKLTQSAKAALDEAAEKIKIELIERAFEITQNRNTSEKEISLRDIIEAKEQILKSKYQEIKKDEKRRRISILISISGSIYAFAGILLYIYQNWESVIKKDLGLIMAGLGLLLIIISFIYYQIPQKKLSIFERINDKKYSFEDLSNYEIVERWNIIEKLTSEVMLKRGLSKNASNSINSIIGFLNNEVVNDNTSKENLKLLLATRNRVAHGIDIISKHEKNILIDFSNIIIEKLENMKNMQNV